MSSQNTQLDEAVQSDLYAATMKEVGLGHLHGPFSEDEVTAHCIKAQKTKSGQSTTEKRRG